MMHDREKSHSAIVAAKPTNKAGSPAAEPVEPRAGTKRNVGEQSTHRTLGREIDADPQGSGGRRSSRRSSTTSTSICSGKRSSRSNATPHPAWMG